MPTPLPNLAGADWLTAPDVQRIFGALSVDGEDVRVVGGAVRNALLGEPVAGIIDFGTTAVPERVMELAAAAGLKAVPTGIEHGTVTLVADGRAYEVTTLREDIETDGRHAVVRFGRDWTADALRRDFTINSLSVDRAGQVHDPARGYADIVTRRVRFIGDPDRRIAEDRLRILRFFRFAAQYARGELDLAGLGACIRGRGDLRLLSGERIGNEMRRLVTAPRAVEVVTAMQDSGVLPIVLGGVGYLGNFARLVRFEATLAISLAAPIRLAALTSSIEEDVERITERLRLSNSERDAMLDALAASRAIIDPADERAARAVFYRHGVDFRPGVMLAFAAGSVAAGESTWRRLYDLSERWTPPRFPLSGRDVLGPAVGPGPAVGEMLRALESWWIAEDFAPDEAALRTRLQQMMAAVQ